MRLSRRPLLSTTLIWQFGVWVPILALGSIINADTGAGKVPLSAGWNLMLPGGILTNISGNGRFQQGIPKEREIVLTFDRPWEGNYSGDSTMIADGGKLRMSYMGRTFDSRGGENPDWTVCYAESTDGVRWIRPDLGLCMFNGSTNNNILMQRLYITISFVPFLDVNPQAAPSARFKALGLLLKPKRGLFAFESADGLRWTQVSEEPVIKEGYFDTQNVSFWDARYGHYVAYVRGYRGKNEENLLPGSPHRDDEGNVRSVLVTTSTDFRTWTTPEWIDFDTLEREHIYHNQIRPYPRSPNLLIGIYARFFPNRELAANSSLATTLFSSETPNKKIYPHAGVSDGGLMWSYNEKLFYRAGVSFLRPGPKFQRWIYPHSMPVYHLSETPAAEPDHPPELSFYVIEDGWWSSLGKYSRMRRYTLRIDGFMSLHADATWVTAETESFVLPSADRLEVNLATGGGGGLQVELLDEHGMPITGFTRTDCPEIYGDALDQEILWRSTGTLKSLAGRKVQLRFYLRDADLYAFRFTSGEHAPLPGAHFQALK